MTSSSGSEINEAINCIEGAINLSNFYHHTDELAMNKYNLGKILKRNGKSMEANKEFQESAELFKKSYRVYNEPRFLKSIRQMYFEIGEPDKTLSYFGELLKESPQNMDYLIELTCSYCLLKNYKKAIKLIKKANNPITLLKKLELLNCNLIPQND